MTAKLRTRSAICALAAGICVAVASCDERAPTTPPPVVGSPVPVIVVRVEVTAPGEIAPGQSVQLAAHAVKSDGSREDISSRAQWLTTAPGILELNSTGLATGRLPGEAFISARLDLTTATARIYVLPPGTYRLGGRTHEFGTPLPEVSIEVLEGTGAGLTTLSRQDGTYALYGVSGPIRLHLKKSGFINAMQNVTVSAHQNRDFGMESDAGYQTYTGTYSLIVTAPGPCSGPFPDAARRRVYTAHVRQGGTSLSVTLADADFILTRGYGNGFSGNSSRGLVFFDLIKGDYYYYYYSIRDYQLVERLTPTSAVVVFGTGEGSGPPSHLRGRLGTIAVTNRMTAPHDPFFAYCNAEFEMVRR